MYKSLKIASVPSNLRLIENLIDEISYQNGFESDFYGKILVACVEAVNNGIVHGNKMNPEKFVYVEVSTDNKTFKIEVEDEGEGFDFENLPDPTSPENIENIHGRGVFLMGHLSDEIDFNNKGKRVEMTFNIG